MDARRRRLAPAVAVPALLLLVFPMFFWSHAAAFGDASAGSDGTMTSLQKHAAFFDRDKDGFVSFTETYEGFRSLGVGRAMSSFTATVINNNLGPKTRPENATSPRTSIYLQNIHKGMHGSDTGAYNSEGRFVLEKFEEIFRKHAKTVPDALNSSDIDELLVANRRPGDYAGWLGATLEWRILYMIGKDKDGLLRKDTVRSVYDGSLFAKIAQENRTSGNQNKIQA